MQNKNLNKNQELQKAKLANRELGALLLEDAGFMNIFFDFGIGRQTKIITADVDLDIEKKLQEISKTNKIMNYQNWTLTDWYYIHTKLKDALDKRGMLETPSNNIFKRKLTKASHAVYDYLSFIYNDFEVR
ncbi:MAG: hypothetical protein GY830_08235 [Bacteroidetes bacterium]|nr:hypothetical protein [Bacteroidota bacterium]